ncbi:MAG: hypothetical protein ACYS4W_04770, partial [Planctomycetota bacterium]
MAGLTDARIEVSSSGNESDPPDITTKLSLKKASLKLDNLPPALSNVCGNVVVKDDLVTIEELTADCGNGAASLTGTIRLGTKAEEFAYDMSLHGDRVKLENDLFRLLPESLRRGVCELQPRGDISCSINLNKATGGLEPDFGITVECLGNSLDFGPFPFLLKNLTGRLEISAECDKTKHAADDAGKTPNNGTVTISGRLVQIDDDPGDSQLELDLESVKIFGGDNEKYVDFRATAAFKNSRLNSFADITDLNAIVKMEGLYKRGEGFQKGHAEIMADKLRLKGICLNALAMDVVYDPGRRSWLASDFLAACCGGRLTGKFQLKQSPDTPLEYLLQTGFENIDVREFLRDRDKCNHAGSQIHFTLVSEPEHRKNSDHEQTTGRLSG